MNCRFCNTALEYQILDLGDQPSANRLLPLSYVEQHDRAVDKPPFPLQVYLCEACKLVQLGETEMPEILFTDDYVYYSSYSKNWVEHARRYVSEITERLSLDAQSFVIEVGSNDGYLLQHFVAKNIPCLGIDPAAQAAEAAKTKGVETCVGFFDSAMAEQVVGERGHCDLILGNNVFAHIPNIVETVAALKTCLTDTGVVTLEFPHLANLVEYFQFDTIYDEHYFYYSLIAVQHILSQQGLRVFDVENVSTHGGSLRIFATPSDNQAFAETAAVKEVLQRERNLALDKRAGYTKFQGQVKNIRLASRKFIAAEKSLGHKIAAFGAAAKGNIFLNYCDIDDSSIDFVVDDTPAKQGKYLPKSRIPVVAEDKIRAEKPDVILILPWNLRDEIAAKLDYVHEWGGKLVTCIPEIEIS